MTVEKASKTEYLADYLDLTFIIDSEGKLSTRLYNQHHDFDFHLVNFLFLSSSIASGPSYGVYISQLTRYADASHITRILDVVTSAWLINVCHKAIDPCGLRSLARNFMANIRISLRNAKGH